MSEVSGFVGSLFPDRRFMIKLTCISFTTVTEAGPSGKSLAVTDVGLVDVCEQYDFDWLPYLRPIPLRSSAVHADTSLEILQHSQISTRTIITSS